MKNKKGFTMVELLAVIAILGTIMAISVPQVFNTIARNKQKSLDIFIENIKTATEGYFSDEQVRINEGLDNADGTTNWGTTITLQKLVDAGFFKTPIKNPKTEDLITPTNVNIAVNYNENKTFDIEVGYGKDALLMIPKIWNIDKTSTSTTIDVLTDVTRYKEDGTVNTTQPTPTIQPINSDGTLGTAVASIDSVNYGAYKVTYDMDYAEGVENPYRIINVSKSLSSLISVDSYGNGFLPGNTTTPNVVAVKEGGSNVNYVVMNADDQGIKVVRNAAYGVNLCWKPSPTDPDNYCSNYYYYADSDIYKTLNNTFLSTLTDKKELVNYKWQIGQQDLPISNVFSEFTESAGLRQSKVGLVTMHEYYNVAVCSDYDSCTFPTNNYLTTGKSLPFFTLTTAQVELPDLTKQPSPYFINSSGLINNVYDELNKKYIYPAIVLPLDTMIIGGSGTSGSPYILKF